MATAFHQESLRKARVIERKQEARKRLMEGLQDTQGQDTSGAALKLQRNIVYSEPHQYEQNRFSLDKFRVTEEGFKNRYRNRQEFMPHCDLAFEVIYPEKDNSDYTSDKNRTYRRMNIEADKYNISAQIN